MICAYCKSDIENDSFYCDQCGKELFVCPTCGKPGKGKNCVEDGAKLFSPKQKSESNLANDINNHNKVARQIILTPNQSEISPISAQSTIIIDDVQLPVLKLINNHLKIDIEIKNGDIIGRTVGDYVSIFTQFPQVSGKHAQFLFDKNKGWCIKDLHSTNGVAINSSPNWQNVPKIHSDKLEILNNNDYLLIANIEFHIKIISPVSTPTGTQRL